MDENLLEIIGRQANHITVIEAELANLKRQWKNQLTGMGVHEALADSIIKNACAVDFS